MCVVQVWGGAPSVLCFFWVFEMGVPPGAWPGQYLGRQLLPATVSVGEVKSLVGAWLHEGAACEIWFDGARTALLAGDVAHA